MNRFQQRALCMTILLVAIMVMGRSASADQSWKPDPGAPDTVVIQSIDWRGDTVVAVEISTTTDDSLSVAQIVVTWSNPALRLESAELDVGRWDVPGFHQWTAAGTDTGAVVAFMPTQRRLPPGSGIIARLIFGRDSTYTFDSDMTITAGALAALPPLAAYETLFADAANDPYLPGEFIGATVAFSPCICTLHGDVSGDGEFNAIDLNTMIDGLFFGGPTPPNDAECPHIHRGDYNCDNMYDAVDLNLIIDFLFFNGAWPCDPCFDLP